MHRFFTAALLATAAPAAAQLPGYTFGLVPKPDTLALFSATPSINNNGTVAFGAFTPGNDAPFLVVGNTTASTVTPAIGARDRFDVSTVSINNNDTAFYNIRGGPSTGVYTLPAGQTTPTRFATTPATLTGLGLYGDDLGGAAGLATGAGRRYVRYNASGAVTVLAADSTASLDSNLSFLFSGFADDSGNVAGVVNIGTSFSQANPEELRLYAADGSGFTTLARNQNGDPASHVVRFSSVEPGLNNLGQSTFIASRTGRVSIFSAVEGVVTELVAGGNEPDAFLDEIFFFATRLGDSGIYTFLARGPGETRGVYVGDLAGNVSRLAGAGDTISAGGVDYLISSIPLASSINDRGDVVFFANVSVGGVSRGAQAFVATVPEPGTLAGLTLAAGVLLRRRRA